MFAVSIPAAIPGKSRAAPAFFGKLGNLFPSRIPEFHSCSFQCSFHPCSSLDNDWKWGFHQRNWILLQRFPGAGILLLCCSLWDSMFSIPKEKLGKKFPIMASHHSFPNPFFLWFPKISQSQRILGLFALLVFQRNQKSQGLSLLFFAEQGDWRTWIQNSQRRWGRGASQAQVIPSLFPLFPLECVSQEDFSLGCLWLNRNFL